MAVRGTNFQKGRRLTTEDWSTLETGTLVFYKGVLMEFHARYGALACLREPNSKIPSGALHITSLRLAVTDNNIQGEPSDSEDATPSDSEDGTSSESEDSTSDELDWLKAQIKTLQARLAILKMRRTH